MLAELLIEKIQLIKSEKSHLTRRPRTSVKTDTYTTNATVSNAVREKNNICGVPRGELVTVAVSAISPHSKQSEMLLSRNSTISSTHEEDNAAPLGSAAAHDQSYDRLTSNMDGARNVHSPADGGRIGERVELCCNRCGNFAQVMNTKNYNNDEMLRRENNFKCDKCSHLSVVHAGSESVDSVEDDEEEPDIGIDDDMDEAELDPERDDEMDLHESEALRLPKIEDKEISTTTTATILKDNNTKPILKFSVSAILGDTREGVRVRNEFIQPQHIWPYLQQNFIHHTHFPHPAFLTHHPHTHPLAHAHPHLPPHHAHLPPPPHQLNAIGGAANGNSCQPQTAAASSSSPGSTISDSDNHSTGTGGSGSGCGSGSNSNSNNNNNNSNTNAIDIRPTYEGVGHNDCEDNNNRRLNLQLAQEKQQQQQHLATAHLQPQHPLQAHMTPHHSPLPGQVAGGHQVIAKPLPSRPTPFLPHSLQHPHLHSLLAHCRNPYMSVGAQVFPLPPGQGFPWAHSTRGKPRRGMMRRAVFSDSQRKGLEKRFQQQKYISKPDRKKLAERLGLKDSQISYVLSLSYYCSRYDMSQLLWNDCEKQIIFTSVKKAITA
ncbi:unnamed protein product [Ceratitis capitata]|uniref:(Mediterranean fruit fly) hypothetical protein n=1 Tax=Ceratitis capitata TaxID=7213 RepID=A0A811UTX8_CERCA|nr:unnamed protein product [Ceratitis capitata]